MEFSFIIFINPSPSERYHGWYMPEEDYSVIKLPKDLVEEIDRYVGTHGYKSRAEVVKEAVRDLLRHYDSIEKSSKRPE
jgi:hypothetical protein